MASENKKISALTNKKLNQLYPELENALVVAMVLNKTEPTIFLSKNDTQYKGVMTFTLRDGPQDIVNCKYWCSREKVEEINEHIQLGDIVDVVCPKISIINQHNDDVKQAQYQPLGSLPISLVLNESQGSFMQKHSYHDLEKYAEIKLLLHQSHKPLYTVMNLADVRGSSSDSKAQAYHTDFLVVVAVIKNPREVRNTKDGRPRRCLEIIIFDQSLTSGMTLTIWHNDWISRAQQFWQPMKTVLHLIDVKVSYSDFYKSSILGLTSKSLIYENPVGLETQQLQEFSKTLPKSAFDSFFQNNSDNLPKPEDIQTVMTVRQIYTRAEGQLRDNSEQFTAVLYAMITHFDIDWPGLVLSKRCKACNRFIGNSNSLKTTCDTEQCQLSFSLGYSGEKFEYFFNINVQFSDHTGTLAEARLTDSIACGILGISSEQYLQLNEMELKMLKWKFLLNHYEVKILLKKPNMIRRRLMALVIDMKPIELDELAKNIAVF